MSIAPVSDTTIFIEQQNIEATRTSALEVQNAVKTIFDLPEEIKLIFVNKLERKALVNLQQTCRYFRDFPIRHDVLWKNLFASENHDYIPKLIPKDWRSFYRESHRVMRAMQNGQASPPKRLLLTGTLDYGTATLGNTHFTIQGFRQITATDLVTGETLYSFTHIPKTAFVNNLEQDEPLWATALQAIDDRLFILNGPKMSIWDAQEKTCIFAAFCTHSPIYVDNDVVVFETKEEMIEIWDYRSKKQVTAFSSKLLRDPRLEAYNDRARVIHLVGSRLFALSWNCFLYCYDYKHETALTMQFREYTEKSYSSFYKTKNHLVSLSRERENLHACTAVSLSFVDNKISPTIWDLGRPDYHLLGFDNLLDFAVPHGDFLFGIDLEDKNAVTCWNLYDKELVHRFKMPGTIWTFQIADCDRVIATYLEAIDRFTLRIWDINNSEHALLEIQSESFDFKIHNNILCLRELERFRFINLSTAREIGAIPFTAFTQKPVFRDIHKTDWAFDGSHIHIEQHDPGDASYWVINL